ncbi:MAG: hypothetical protein WA954_10845 [Parerythrobacter sp.]
MIAVIALFECAAALCAREAADVVCAATVDAAKALLRAETVQ